MKMQKYSSVYSFLWDVIRPFKWHYLAMLSAPILASFYDVANNYALKMVVDAFSVPGDVSIRDLALPISLFIVAQILLDVFWRASDIAEWRSEPYVRQEILTKVYDHVQSSPYDFFQGEKSGSITSKVKGMLDGYDHFWAAMHHDFTPRLVNSLVLTATLAIVNVEVCCWMALWAAIFIGIMYKFSRILDRLSFINSTHRHDIIGLIADNISNIATIFSFASKKFELNRLNKAIEKDFIPSNIKVYKMSFLSNVIAAVIYWIMLFAIFLYMIHLRSTNQVSSGDVVFVMGISLKVSWELWQVVQKLQDFMKNIGDFKAAFTVMLIPNAEQSGGLLKLEVKHPTIVFDHIYFSYGEKHPVFRDLSFNIRAGEKIGLVGISGAGKSTLVSLLLRNFTVDKGSILIDGKDISHYSMDSVRENIAVIPQDIMLFHRNIFDNIRYGRLNASMEEVIAAARMANIHDFIDLLPEKYDSFVGERGIKLSGGQRQRIAIARAMLKNAPILILDEATSSLDTETEHLIQKSLSKIFENSTTTVVAIAHRLSTIKHMDRIIVLEKGRIVEQGTHDYLIKNCELYGRLWEMQKL